MLDEITLQRLGWIHYLYETAMEESRRPEPFGLISILKFHDCVELFLDLACDKFGIPANKTYRFKDYWTELEKHLQNQNLSEKRSMERLNDARVSFKHHGNLPHSTSIEKFRVNVSDFFEENTPLIFGIAFNKISMIYLIQNNAVKKLLEEAATLIEKDQLWEALGKIAIAFIQMIDRYMESKDVGPYLRHKVLFARDIFPPSYRSKQDQELEAFTKQITSSLDGLREGLQILSLGINYQQYVKFRLLTPSISRTMDGVYHVLARQLSTEPTIEQCRFCYEFVIACATHLQNIDFEVEME